MGNDGVLVIEQRSHSANKPEIAVYVETSAGLYLTLTIYRHIVGHGE
jgi:hypothetical protein